MNVSKDFTSGKNLSIYINNILGERATKIGLSEFVTDTCAIAVSSKNWNTDIVYCTGYGTELDFIRIKQGVRQITKETVNQDIVPEILDCWKLSKKRLEESGDDKIKVVEINDRYIDWSVEGAVDAINKGGAFDGKKLSTSIVRKYIKDTIEKRNKT